MNKQPALTADPATVSGETPISTDDAVARNHNGNRVCAVGQANSTDRFRAPQLTRQRPITHRRSGSDRPECRPNLALKGRASGRHGNGVDREEIAKEIVVGRAANFGRCGAILYDEVTSFRGVMKPQKTPHARLEVVKVQSAQMPFAIMDEKQCPDRGLEAICV